MPTMPQDERPSSPVLPASSDRIATPGPAPSGRLARLLAAGAASIFVIHVLGAGLSFVLQVVFVQWLGVQGFGILSFALAIATIAAVVGAAGWPAIVVRFAGEYQAQDDLARWRGLARTGAWAVAAGTATAAAAVALAFLAVPALASSPYRATVLVALAIVPMLGLSLFTSEILRTIGRWGAAFAVPRVVRPVLVLVVGAAAVASGVTFTPARLALLVVSAYAAVIAWQAAIASRRLPWRSAAPNPLRETRRWLGVGAAMFFVSSAGTLIDESDLLVVGAMLGPEATGIYQAASRSSRLVQFVPVAAMAVAGPLFSQWFHDPRRSAKDLQRLVTLTVRWTATATGVVGAGLVAASGVVLGLFGPEFQAARLELGVLVAARIAAAFLGPAGLLLYIAGHHRRVAAALGAAAVLNLVLNVLLVPVWGLMGAAAATAIALLAASSMNAFHARRHLALNATVAGRLPSL